MDKYTEIRPIVLGVAKRGDKLLVAKGYDCKKNEVFYRALGGGIEFLEKSEDALRREFFEELGIDIEVGEYIGLFENIFEFNGKKAHELVLVYNIKIRDDDYIVYADIFIDNTNILVYSEDGDYTFIKGEDVPTQSKVGTGLQCIKVSGKDKCKGIAAIGSEDTHVIVVTERGFVKRCETVYLGQPGKRKVSSYLCSMEANDKVIWVGAVNEKVEKRLCIFTRTDYTEIQIEDIPVYARKAKGKKMISVPMGSNLIDIKVL